MAPHLPVILGHGRWRQAWKWRCCRCTACWALRAGCQTNPNWAGSIRFALAHNNPLRWPIQFWWRRSPGAYVLTGESMDPNYVCPPCIPRWKEVPDEITSLSTGSTSVDASASESQTSETECYRGLHSPKEERWIGRERKQRMRRGCIWKRKQKKGKGKGKGKGSCFFACAFQGQQTDGRKPFRTELNPFFAANRFIRW